MNRFKSIFSVYLTIGLMLAGFIGQTSAQVNNRNEREVRNIVRSLNSKIDDFRYNLNNELRQSRISRQDRTDFENNLRNLTNKIRDFETNFDRQSETGDDVTNILDAARNVDGFLKVNRLTNRVQNDWRDVQSLIDRLASNYNLSTEDNYPVDDNDSDDDRYPNNSPTTTTTNSNFSYSLTGTYQLDVSRSENTNDIAERAIQSGNVRNSSGGNAQQDLEDKLEAPEQIAIDLRGNQVTLASSKAQPITFTADGRDRTETSASGKTIRLRATLRGQELVVSSLGGETDYTITFTSIDNGRSMKVTRRITTDYLNQTVFAESVYNKTDSIARLGIDNGGGNTGTYSSNDSTDNPNNNPNNYPTTTTGRRGEYIVPNGTILTGTLDNEISTKVSQNNDRFKMTVTAPNEFRGAVIEGYISGINRTGRVSGRSQITFNFERIRLKNGQTYDFAGFLQSVTDQNGKTVKVDTEGAAKGDSQTKETVKRGGIGAGIGAVIGAIAGGAKGAAIGAIIGGGAGAGSVIVQGRDDLELKQGSSITVQSSSPNR